MNKSALGIALLCSVACAPSCAVSGDDSDDSDDSQVGEAHQDMISLNGTSLNGTSMTGSTPAGSSLNNTTLAGVSTIGTSQGGGAILASSLAAPPLSGATLNNSIWNGTASNGAAVKLRIDSSLQGTEGNSELWFYAVSYETSTGWSPLCGLDAANQPLRAVAVAGVWSSIIGDTASYGPSSTRFTLACRTRTVAKCVEVGYKTYDGRAAQLASCVRMLRGDYCGTGATYTVDGTTLNFYDNVGVATDSETWAAEAEWTPSGARCVNSNNAKRYEAAQLEDPKCVKHLKAPTCGASFADGAILIDELSDQN